MTARVEDVLDELDILARNCEGMAVGGVIDAGGTADNVRRVRDMLAPPDGYAWALVSADDPRRMLLGAYMAERDAAVAAARGVRTAAAALAGVFGSPTAARTYLVLWREAAERDAAEGKTFSVNPTTMLAVLDVLWAAMERL